MVIVGLNVRLIIDKVNVQIKTKIVKIYLPFRLGALPNFKTRFFSGKRWGAATLKGLENISRL